MVVQKNGMHTFSIGRLFVFTGSSGTSDETLHIFFTDSHLDGHICSGGTVMSHSVFPAFKLFIWMPILEREDEKC